MSIIPPNNIRNAIEIIIPIMKEFEMFLTYHSISNKRVHIQMHPTIIDSIANGINFDGFILLLELCRL